MHMTANPNVRLDPSRVGTRRGGKVAAGGIGGMSIIGIILYLIFGGDLGGGGGGPSGGLVPDDQGQQQEEAINLDHCTTGESANKDVNCRMVFTAESLDALWAEMLPAEAGEEYVPPGLIVFEGSVSTACGNASSAMGPFYCPADQTVYLDTGFFDALETQLGAENAPLAQMYIVAHEFGHHIQNQTGILSRIDRRDSGEDGDNVRSELQADCLAGIWVGHASKTVDPETGEAFLEEPTQEQIRQAQGAAEAVGDDRIQEGSGMEVNPDTWTHGSAEKREEWFTRGYEEGTFESCDTFSVDQP